MKCTILLVSALLGFAMISSATEIFTEDFQATTGNENGVAWPSADASGLWTSGYTQGEAPVSSSGDLFYVGLVASAGNGKLNLHNPTAAARGLTRNGTDWTSVDSGGYYCSFLLNVSDFSSFGTTWDLGDQILSLYVTAGSNVLGLRGDGAGGGFIMLAEREADLAAGPGDAQSSGEVALNANTTYLIVIGADNVTDSAAGSFELWVNPASLGGAAPTATTAGEWRFGVGVNSRIWLGNAELTGASLTGVNMDELRIGTTYADVTPADSTPRGTYFLID